MLRTSRFFGEFLRPGSAAVQATEVRVPIAGEEVPATLYLPAGRRDVPGWVVLHGLTVTGRAHASLTRFARAVCASGSAVLIPEIRAWTELRIDTAAARAAIRDDTAYLRERVDSPTVAMGTIGFSFGATQALIAAAEPGTAPEHPSVVGFGGYADLPRTTHFMVTGEHEWNGTRHTLAPDPYGRWILGANYLAAVTGLEEMTAVREGLHRLALAAGRQAIPAASAELDPLNVTIRRSLAAAEQEVWDLLAPLSGEPPARSAAADDLARHLAAAALLRDPGLDPSSALAALSARVTLAHGFADRLVPFTETLRLHSLIGATADTDAAVTRLFAHSAGEAGVHPLRSAAEAVRFARLMRRALRHT